MTINSRIKQLRLQLGSTQKLFARDLGITQGNLSFIEAEKTSVTVEVVRALQQKFDVSYEWLIDGKPFLKRTEKLIPLIDKSALAGYPSVFHDDEFLHKLDLYKIPGFEDGKYRIFEIEGDSMVPTLLPHDYVVVAKIENLDKIIDGSITVIVTEEEVLAKRFYRDGKKDIRLESDNSKFRPVNYKRSELVEVWCVQAKITQSFHKPEVNNDDTLKQMQDQLRTLRDEIDLIKKSI